ncbi:hypothetical protein HHI36_012791 [Cryptolaemus montrouzieri]|uniref:HTH psq-type domain-containing protein n=1 Tax=Cryptolaemus montrouzieri TaxID=559131 RepID=A0ABD2NF88_9CUCU
MSKVSDFKISYKKVYNEEDIAQALQATAEWLSERKASVKFGVPRSTLLSSNKFHNETKSGPDPVLPFEEENLIEDWIKTSKDVPFPGNKPGRGWFKAFLRRHLDITFRTPEAITAASANISEHDILKRFTEMEVYLVEK